MKIPMDANRRIYINKLQSINVNAKGQGQGQGQGRWPGQGIGSNRDLWCVSWTNTQTVKHTDSLILRQRQQCEALLIVNV